MKELLGMALVVAMLGTISGVFIYLSCDAIPDQGAAFGYIMSNPMWINGDGTVGPFYGLDRARHMLSDLAEQPLEPSESTAILTAFFLSEQRLLQDFRGHCDGLRYGHRRRHCNFKCGDAESTRKAQKPDDGPHSLYADAAQQAHEC